jgi:hypothetical protein
MFNHRVLDWEVFEQTQEEIDADIHSRQQELSETLEAINVVEHLRDTTTFGIQMIVGSFLAQNNQQTPSDVAPQ